MKTFILPAKIPFENLTVQVPFLDMLLVGETVNAVTVAIAVFSGTDATPSNVLLGSPTIDPTNTIAIFTLTGGVSGAIYIVTVTATGSISNIVSKTGYLTIVPVNPF